MILCVCLCEFFWVYFCFYWEITLIHSSVSYTIFMNNPFSHVHHFWINCFSLLQSFQFDFLLHFISKIRDCWCSITSKFKQFTHLFVAFNWNEGYSIFGLVNQNPIKKCSIIIPLGHLIKFMNTNCSGFKNAD